MSIDPCVILYGKQYKIVLLRIMADQSYFDLVYYVTRQIPKGRVCNYGAIADYLSLGSARMVGWALTQANRSAETMVPAHRVVNKKGQLTGRLNFATPTLMQELLEAEGIHIEDHTVIDFDKHFWHPQQLDDDTH